MRLVIAAASLVSLAGLAAAQVPGTVGPPPDSRQSPGSEGPTIACRLFDFGCKPAPEAVAARPVPEDQAAPAPKAQRKSRPKPKSKAKTEGSAAPDPAQ